MKYNEVPIHKIIEAQRLLELGNPIVRIGKNKHDASKAVFYFNGTNKFFVDWNIIKTNQNKKAESEFTIAIPSKKALEYGICDKMIEDIDEILD